jgi:hypothetical protein
MYFLDGKFKKYKRRTIEGSDPYQELKLTDQDYFEDLSWTISYDLTEQA